MPANNNIEALMRARALQQGYDPRTGVYSPGNPSGALPPVTAPYDAPWQTAGANARVPIGQGGVPGGNMPGGMGGYPTAPQAAPNVPNQVAAAIRAMSEGPQSGLGQTGQVSPNSGVAPGLSPGSEALVRGTAPNQERFAQGARAGSLADELRQSSLEPVSGKMVGNIYVPASIAQHGAKLIEAYVARKKEKEQKAERAASAEKTGSMRWDWLKDLDTEDRAKAMLLLETPDG